MSNQNEKEIPWQVNFPDEDRVTRHFKTSLVDICCGNERIADALDYFVFTASWEVKNKGIAKGCKVAKITRTHKEIMERLQFNTSRRSLIHYLDLFNEWGYVLSQPYQRDFEVNFETIQNAINDPSKRPQRSTRSKVKTQEEETDEKGCNVAGLHTCTGECEHAKKVATLHTKVADLQHKVATLHKKVESLATLQPAFEALVKLVESHFSEPTVITSILPLLTGREDIAPAFADRNALTPSLSKISLLDDNVIRVAFSDWDAQEKEPQREEMPLLPVASESLSTLRSMALSSKYSEDETNPYLDIPQIAQVEIPQLHRLTNPPEPLTENIPSTDESPREIEAETAEHTPSSPVVNAATDEVIHTDTRNTTNSYSPPSESKNTPDAEPVTEQAETPVTGKGSGKGKGSGRGGRKKSEPPTEDQFRKVFDTMNEVFRKLHPETPDFKVIETKKAREYVQTLIEAKGNPALLKLTMFDMWNEVDARGEHWWRKTGRMTVRAIIEQYTSRAPMLASKLPNHATAKSEAVKEALADNTASKPPIVVSSSPLGAYSSRPELQPWKDDGAVSDDALNRPSWAAIKKQRKQAAGGR